MEFDIYDRSTDTFLSTKRRQIMLHDYPFVVSVKVLHAGKVQNLQQLQNMISPSHFICQDQTASLAAQCKERGLDFTRVQAETDASGLMEGLYIKVEEGGIVKERYKYVRSGFLQNVIDSGSHWMDRPILPNLLAPGKELFG
jgi:hypothetical protein